LISTFRNKIVVDKDALLALATRRRQWEQMAKGLRERLEDEHMLLLRALHELASERGVKDHRHFADRWYREAVKPEKATWERRSA